MCAAGACDVTDCAWRAVNATEPTSSADSTSLIRTSRAHGEPTIRGLGNPGRQRLYHYDVLRESPRRGSTRLGVNFMLERIDSNGFSAAAIGGCRNRLPRGGAVIGQSRCKQKTAD